MGGHVPEEEAAVYSSSLTYYILYFLCIIIFSLSMDIHESTAWTCRQHRLAEVWGGLGEECKHSEIGVSEALICSCQVTAQADKCQLCQSVFLATAVSCNHLMNLFFFLRSLFKTNTNWKSGSLFFICSLHYMMLIGFCFSSFAFNFSAAALISGEKTAQTCQEGLLLLYL